jgi:hypothetical protein
VGEPAQPNAAPRRKQDLLVACAVIAHDRRVDVEEGELLRAPPTQLHARCRLLPVSRWRRGRAPQWSWSGAVARRPSPR